jgi:hypothetical protein
MNQMMNTGEFTGMQRTVDMADETRTIGMTVKNKGREQARFDKIKVMTHNYLTDFSEINSKARQIKATQQERLMMEKRLGQISSAKKMFHRSITNTQLDHNSNLMHQSHSFMDHPRKTY